MRYRNPNEDIIRRLMGKPPRKKIEGIKRTKANPKGVSKDVSGSKINMSFREKIANLVKAGGRIARRGANTTKPFLAVKGAYGKPPSKLPRKKKPAVVKPKKK